MGTANDGMVGGNHYREIAGEQHWDRMWRLYGRGYFVGCATKYIERYHLKNGIQDLEKAKHFIQKLIELEQVALNRQQFDRNPYVPPVAVDSTILTLEAEIARRVNANVPPVITGDNGEGD